MQRHSFYPRTNPRRETSLVRQNQIPLKLHPMIPFPCPPPPQADDLLPLPMKPASFIIRRLDLALTAIASLVAAFLSLFSDSKASVEDAPTCVATSGLSLLRKLTFGLLGAAYVSLVLVVVLVLAAVIGVGITRWWIEEPVSLRKPLYFDYTEQNPSAAVAVRSVKPAGKAASVGHEFAVSMELLLPESDYNTQIGIFQVTAEALASTGDVVANSGQPCMLRLRSTPIRLMRTFAMGIPLVLGFSCETQTLTIDLLHHRETIPRTEAIKITLRPRAGTVDLPQLYGANLILESRLPWRKRIAHNWKWTFYVWTSFYVYLMLLLPVVYCCLRPFRQLPRLSFRWARRRRMEVEREDGNGEGEVSEELEEVLRRWRSRRKGKVVVDGNGAASLDGDGGQALEGGGEAISSNVGEVIDESGDFAESESSECVGSSEL